LRIALLWPVYFPDFSAGSVRCAALARHLTRLGNEVVVLVPSDSHGDKTSDRDTYRVDRIPSYETFSRSLGFGAAVLFSPVAFRNVRKSLLKVDPDLVIASTPGPLLALEAYLATRRMDVPYVLDFRDPWRSGRYLHRGAIRNWSKQVAEEFLCIRSDLVLCVTRSLREMVVREYGVNPDKAVVVTNGAEEGKAGTPRVEKEYDVVFLGTPSAYKNLEELLGAFAIVTSSMSLTALFVGWIDNQYTRTLKVLAERLGLAKSVKFLSQIPNEEVRDVISKAKVAIETVGGPPSFAWAVGAKNYEYLAAGLPIACLSKFRDGEMYDFVTGDVGIVANSKSDFARELIEMLEDDSKLEQMSENALKYSKRFSWKSIVTELYENHLRELVGEQS